MPFPPWTGSWLPNYAQPLQGYRPQQDHVKQNGGGPNYSGDTFSGSEILRVQNDRTFTPYYGEDWKSSTHIAPNGFSVSAIIKNPLCLPLFVAIGHYDISTPIEGTTTVLDFYLNQAGVVTLPVKFPLRANGYRPSGLIFGNAVVGGQTFVPNGANTPYFALSPPKSFGIDLSFIQQMIRFAFKFDEVRYTATYPSYTAGNEVIVGIAGMSLDGTADI